MKYTYILTLLFLFMASPALDKYEMFFVGDERTNEAKHKMKIFDDAVEGMGVQYKWNGPANSLAVDTSDCNYHVNYICNFIEENKSVHVVLAFSEIDGTNTFEISFSKDTIKPEEDAKKIIVELMKIGIDKLSIIHRLR